MAQEEGKRVGNTADLRPRRIQVKKASRELVIGWRDGSEGRIALSDLRTNCPCATCRQHRQRLEQEAGLHVISGEEMATTDEVLGVVPVGRYAVKVSWADGHSTGIYTYGHLRRLTLNVPEGKG